MSNLVFTGKAYELRGDDEPVAIRQPGDMPKLPQKVRQIRRVYPSIVAPMRTKHNGYRPGKLIDLCTDQCRFSVADGIMCGVKVSHGAWCAHHLAVVYPARRRFMDAAE